MRLRHLAFAVFTLSCGAPLAAATQEARQPVDFVSPNIGAIGQLLTPTMPYVQLPYGMARIAPITTPGVQDRYLADKIYGFPVGASTLMISTGKWSTRLEDTASEFDHDFEKATPYDYQVRLETPRIEAEFTAANQAVIYRFTSEKSQQVQFILSLGNGAKLSLVGPNAVEGSERLTGPIGEITNTDQETREYFYAEFSKPFSNSKTWEGSPQPQNSGRNDGRIGFGFETTATASQPIEVRVGISYISADQAERNLRRDLGAKDFEAIKESNRNTWNAALGKVRIEGATDRQNTIFYTALWRSLGRMTDITEDGRYFSAYDHAIHNAEGHDFYVDDGIWDTYRSLHPLQLLLDGHRQEDMVRSYLRMYQQSGWLPSFPSVAGEQAVMIGHHAAELILDTYSKNYRDFDLKLAYDAVRKNATEATMLPWRRGTLTSLDHVYFDQGFFPALAWGEREDVPEVHKWERRQAVSVTLETAYDDWSVAQLAKALNKTEDAEYFTHLAHNYQTIFDPQIGFMAPRSADGTWVKNFDPKLAGGQGGRDYTTEVNSWLYTFSVQHDPEGLIRLLGGREAFNARLDRLFTEQYGTSKFAFLGQFPDATGLVGLYAQGNEPSFHIPYLYDFSGQPWKAQKRIRQLLDVWYTDDPHGIPGDDDGGETSSWYVLSALGFYPECPGSPVYEIGSPIFQRATVRMGNGKSLTIAARNVSARNKYIQSATLNGKPWNKAWFAHTDIENGGALVFTMGDRPNYGWGARPEDAPPSMTPVQP